MRDGMRLDSWTYTMGDMTRQIELVVRRGEEDRRVRVEIEDIGAR